MIWSVLRWVLVMFLYGIVILTSYIMFPLLWVFREQITDKKIPFLYIYFDSEDGYYGDPEWREERGLEQNFWTALRWSWRNPAWNFWLYFKPKQGDKSPIKVIDTTSYDDWRDDFYIPCQIKTDNENFGEYFSPEASILGMRFVVYHIDKNVYWRWSKANQKKGNIFIEWELGYNDSRYVLNRNRKKLKLK